MSDLENSAIEGLLNDLIEHQTAITNFFSSTKVKFTLEGGIAVKLINKTGSASVKGSVIVAGTVSNSFVLSSIAEVQPIGVVYESGIVDGEECLVVVQGIAEILLQDSTASTSSYWVFTSSTQAGRGDATLLVPPGGGIPELDEHMKELGHCIENKTQGTNVLCKIILHLN